jgi:hypothetical protein
MVFFANLITAAETSNGLPPNPEIKTYNDSAVSRNLPKLTGYSIGKKITKNEIRPKDIVDTFTTKDQQAVILTKWNNFAGTHTFKSLIYDPRGFLYDEGTITRSTSTTSSMYSEGIYIQNSPPQRLPGVWRSEMYMNDLLVIKKDIVIGSSTTTYPPLPDESAPSIAFFNFIPDGKSGKYYYIKVPDYLGRMASIDFPHYRTLMPFTTSKEYTLPVQMSKNEIEKKLNNLKSDEILKDFVKKHHAKILFFGRTYDDGDATSWITVYAINANTMELIDEELETTTSLFADGKLVSEVVHKAAANVYSNLKKKLYDDIQTILMSK